jgi:hypothetical protein
MKLSPGHPSLLLTLQPQSIPTAPLVVNQDGVLVDGYRRFQMMPNDQLPTHEVHTTNIVQMAFDLNRSTRAWDDVDCFLWMRWAREMNVSVNGLPIQKFSQSLFQLETDTLRDLARRRLGLRQASLLQETPARYRSILQRILTNQIVLNQNSSGAFIEMSCDLANKDAKRDLESLFARSPLSEILADASITPQQKGDRLLKAMRVLRYPYYEQKSEQFSSSWRRLQLEDFQPRKGAFIERGVLEVSFSASSFQELKEKAKKLNDSMESPEWEELWQTE